MKLTEIRVMMRSPEVVDGTGYIGTVTYRLVDVGHLDTSSSNVIAERLAGSDRTEECAGRVSEFHQSLLPDPCC